MKSNLQKANYIQTTIEHMSLSRKKSHNSVKNTLQEIETRMSWSLQKRTGYLLTKKVLLFLENYF